MSQPQTQDSREDQERREKIERCDSKEVRVGPGHHLNG
jgi:hypothetical protein